MRDLHLQEFQANSFLGIDSESPVIIEFGKFKKGQNVLTVKGDQELGKTSTLTAIMVMMGGAFGFDVKNFYNRKDDAIDVSLSFKYEGDDYEAKMSGTRLSLKRFYKNAGKEGKWIAEGSPKDTLRTIFGNLGVSPMFLKDMPGKKQIQWFKESMGTDEDVSKKEEKKITELKTKESSRTECGREIKSLKGWLDQSVLFTNYEESQTRFKTTINAEKEKANFDAIAQKKNGYDQYQNTVNVTEAEVAGMDRQITEVDRQIKELEKKRETLQATKDKTVESVNKGKEFLKTNAGIIKEYESANKKWIDLSKNLADQESWKEVLRKEKDYNVKTEEYTQYDADIDKLRQELLKLTKSYLPKTIEGLEVRVKVKLDDEDEGIYYKGKTLAQLSESELWGLFAQIWAEKEVQFVFCENISDLGSNAVALLNSLVKEGARIFASEMDRSKKEMEISVTTKIV